MLPINASRTRLNVNQTLYAGEKDWNKNVSSSSCVSEHHDNQLIPSPEIVLIWQNSQIDKLNGKNPFR